MLEIGANARNRSARAAATLPFIALPLGSIGVARNFTV
jgi:hypothetical protein